MGLYSCRIVVFGQKWLFSWKVDIFVQNVCIRAKLLVFGKWL